MEGVSQEGAGLLWGKGMSSAAGTEPGSEAEAKSRGSRRTPDRAITRTPPPHRALALFAWAPCPRLLFPLLVHRNVLVSFPPAILG